MNTRPPIIRRPRRNKRLRLVATAMVILLLILLSPLLIGSIIGYKLRIEIASRTNATLDMGKVLYLPPYTLRVSNARLYAHDPALKGVPILRIAKLQITLARLPLGNGPLLIRELDIHQPELHLVQTPTGLSAAAALFNQIAPATARPQKLSDLFELRHVAITDGTTEYDDRSHSTSPPPIIWQHLSADLRTAPTAPSKYHYQFVAPNAPLVSITSTGTIDIDALLLDVSTFVLDLQTRPSEPAQQLPWQVQEIFHRFAVAGHVTLDATAHIPLTNPAGMVFASQLRLQDGSARIPGWNAPIAPVQFSVDCYKEPQDSLHPSPPTDVRLRLNQFLLQCDKQQIRFDRGEARFSGVDNSWSVANVSGLIDAGDGPGPARDLDLLAHLPVTINGSGALSPAGNFMLHVLVKNGDLDVAPQKIPFRNINSNLAITSSTISTIGLTANVYDGPILFDGLIDWSPPVGILYSGQGNITNLNMKEFGETFIADPADRQRVSGAGDLRAHFAGDTTTDFPAQTFTAAGDVDIRHGHFFLIPVLKDVMRRSKHGDAATVGEVAATFDIAHRNINLPHFAASSTLVGVQGNGRITFDGDVDMTLAVASLSDWRKDVDETDIPILSELLGYLAGGAQKAANAVVRDAIDQFRVTGKATNPKVKQVPVPILSDAVRSLFHVMSFAKAEDAISQELRRLQSLESATRPSQP